MFCSSHTSTASTPMCSLFTMDCQKCSQIITEGAMYTVCEGKCSKRFHASCVGVDEQQWNALSNNIIWLCDCCMADFCKYRERREPLQIATRSVDQEIMELKTKVATIFETLAAITASEKTSSDGKTQRHSTPVSSPCLHGATNSMCENSQADVYVSDEQHSQNDDNKTFDLFVTNIDPNVTEKDISFMVARCLGINSVDIIDVRKLVSREKVCSRLDYVSFKIALQEQYKELAMCKTTWPKRVKIREFVNRHNETWKP